MSRLTTKRITFDVLPDLSADDLTHWIPKMSKEDYSALVLSLQEHGYIGDPIMLREADDGRLFLLDGRNRYRACKELGIMPDFVVVAQSYSRDVLEAEVWRRNGPRRHLSKQDMALALLRLGKTVTRAAEMAGVSRETVRRAQRNVANSGIPDAEVDRRLKSGESVVNEAKSLAEDRGAIRHFDAGRVSNARPEPWMVAMTAEQKRVLRVWAAIHGYSSPKRAINALVTRMETALKDGKTVELVVVERPTDKDL